MQRFSGTQYLKIDIASMYGLDKQTWDRRITWVDDHENQLEEMVSLAENPALFYASVQAYRKAQAGIASGYPINLDATSSGLQILAVLTGDRQAAQLCNVVSTGQREDAYTGIYETMLARHSLDSKIQRKDVKQAIMTALYGSQAMPKKIFGEGKLLENFYETMRERAPGAWELNEVMLQVWNDDALEYNWIMPDGFEVKCRVMDSISRTVHFLDEPFEIIRKVNAPIKEGRSLGANMVHSVDGMIVREMVRRCSYDPETVGYVSELIANDDTNWHSYLITDDDKMVVKLWDLYEKTGFLSARILDHLNPNNGGHVNLGTVQSLIGSLPLERFEMVSVHDCFRCLPNHGNDLRQQYNIQLMLIAKSNLLSYLLSQITGRDVKVGKLDQDLHRDILETEYALS